MRRPPPRATLTSTLFPYTTRFRSRPKAWKVNRIGEHSRRVGRRASLPRWMERSGATLPAPTSKATSGSAGAPMTGMPRVRPEHTYMDVVKFRKENLHRYWCNRSEEHTSELQSLMRISYAVFCLKKKKK